jgi:hypothetical protein
VAGQANCEEGAFLEKLCLAQQQELYVWQCEKSGKSGATAATLAFGAVGLYGSCMNEVGGMKNAPKNWKEKLEVRKTVMLLVGATGEARDGDTEKGLGHGRKIGQLLAAQQQIQQLNKKTVSECLLDGPVEHYSQQAFNLLRVLVKENDTIYFTRVLEGVPPPGKVLAKALAPDESKETDVWLGLVSPALRTKMSHYEAYRDQLLTSLSSHVAHQTELVRSQLEALGLPGAAQAPAGGVPAPLLKQVNEVRQLLI